MKTKTLHIKGMTCVNCQHKIENTLKNTVGIEAVEVSYNTGTARIGYNPDCISLREITSIIENLDYQVSNTPRQEPALQLVGSLIIIFALYMLLRRFGAGGLASAFPLAEAGMSYGMLFIIGLITSVHCAAMCGGINLSQTLLKNPPRDTGRDRLLLLPGIFYNTGRVVSYTVIGGIVGALGSVITVSGRMQGVVQLIAGIFMVIMGVNMLGIGGTWLRRLNLRMPQIFAKKIDPEKQTSKSPFFIGLLNGLMPCGPLQAMQIYALSTGNPLTGGLSMFLFSLGTVPFMFGLSALSSLLSKRFTFGVMKVGAVLVTVLGLTMVSNGWSLGGLPDISQLTSGQFKPALRNTGVPTPAAFQPVLEQGVQIIASTLKGGRYPAITVQAGIPVKWIITAPAGSINGCNNRMILRQYGIEHRFQPGENVIEFTPDKTGKFSYSCWMGMIRSSITVVEAGTNLADLNAEPEITPKPAGVQIPTDTVGVAQIHEQGFQEITTTLTDNGFESSIIVLQRYVPTRWIINNDSLDPGNGELIFPAYYTQITMEAGDNIIQLMPEGDFDFSTVDNVFYGYVKVVDDLNAIDMEAIKQEVADFETLIYPQAYFDTISQAPGGCCGGSGA
ncbi:MAG: sulfite exporter TauE/SafE family protein [Treponema sp.]|jgi:sulfite exporter TauE/SafE/copper chaperone CopZ/plastocyanin domain-containing protein|nr:sulfite exporter TauE/SafE family protein [Treponema sp.]